VLPAASSGYVISPRCAGRATGAQCAMTRPATFDS
jgi:hypothetical protein